MTHLRMDLTARWTRWTLAQLLLFMVAHTANGSNLQVLDSLCKRTVWMSGIQVKDYTGT
jgi:hypothetical protein